MPFLDSAICVAFVLEVLSWVWRFPGISLYKGKIGMIANTWTEGQTLNLICNKLNKSHPLFPALDLWMKWSNSSSQAGIIRGWDLILWVIAPHFKQRITKVWKEIILCLASSGERPPYRQHGIGQTWKIYVNWVILMNIELLRVCERHSWNFFAMFCHIWCTHYWIYVYLQRIYWCIDTQFFSFAARHNTASI